MTPADLSDLQALWRDVRDWLPPASTDDDPEADWRTVTTEQFRAWRMKRDPELVKRFAAILERERSAMLRGMRESLNEPAPALALVPKASADTAASRVNGG